MSARQVLATVTAALEHVDTGLGARVRALRDLTPSGAAVRDDFTFDVWAPRLESATTRGPIVTVTQDAATRELRQGVPKMPDYMADRRVVITIQLWSPDRRVIQDSVNVYEGALCWVLEELRAYSDATGGTVVTVGDTAEIADLSLPGADGVLSDGLVGTVVLSERSAES